MEIDGLPITNLFLAATFFDVKAIFVSHYDLPIRESLHDEDAFALWKKYVSIARKEHGMHIPTENNIGKLFAFLQKIARFENYF